MYSALDARPCAVIPRAWARRRSAHRWPARGVLPSVCVGYERDVRACLAANALARKACALRPQAPVADDARAPRIASAYQRSRSAVTIFASVLFGIPPLVKIAQLLFFKKTVGKVSTYEEEWDFEAELYDTADQGGGGRNKKERN